MQISPEMARGLWSHLATEFDFTVVDKDDSAMMDAVGGFLDAFGVLDKEEFLQNYGTTFFSTIYVPFLPGEVSRRWDPIAQCSMVIHEGTHVWQCDRDGAFIFAGGYLAKDSTRAEHEAEAYSTNMAFRYWLTGRMPSSSDYAQRILNYACDDDEVAFVDAYLQMRIPAIEAREWEQISPVLDSAIKWLEAQRR